MRTALITGITGQDGSYLTELLLDKGYFVYGVIRKTSHPNLARIEHLLDNERLQLKYADLTDSSSIIKIISEAKPDEIYNLGAQSHVQVSFETPEYTADVDAIGSVRILEAIRILGLGDRTKFYQASTSELFGLTTEQYQNEETEFRPCSPYAVSKLFSYWTTVNYRRAYSIFAVNGILFNHESPRRGDSFVTRKITKAAARIKCGLQEKLCLGRLDTKRDWGHSKDYVNAMWLIMQAEKPSDYVIATGKTTSVREFCIKAFKRAGYEIEFIGSGIEEKGIDRASGRVLIEIAPEYFRPNEIEYLCGDSSKAKRELGWEPKYDIDMLIDEMYENDYKEAIRERQSKEIELYTCK